MRMQIFVIAIILFFTASLAFSQTAKVHFDKAMTKYYVENDLDGAVTELEEALKIDPYYEDAERFLKILLNQKRMESIEQMPVKETPPLETVPVRNEFLNGSSKPDILQEAKSPVTEVSPPPQPEPEAPKEVVISTTPVEEISPKHLDKILKPYQGTGEYVINLDDALEISVWQNEEFTREVTVRPDGRISYPLAGDIPAQGLTLTELNVIITERLKEYLRNPQVYIIVKKLGGNKVIVLGEVKSPGVYRFTGETRLLEVVGLAGGFGEEAKLKNVLVIRGDIINNKAKASSINVAKVWKEAKMDNNVQIEPMDIIYVPRSTIGNLNLFIRQITPSLSVIYQSVVTQDVLRR
jgi:polysaccharide export outer membrane protein